MWLTLFLLVCVLGVSGGAAVRRLAVVRPFAVADTARLVPSFDDWNVHLPCAAAAAAGPPGVTVDLFLCFSQDLANDTQAALATQTVVQDWHNQTAGAGTWHRCFADVRVISAGLAPGDDTYRPLQANAHSAEWVRGPNKQFLFMALFFQNNVWDDYDAWFLMEMDCVARRSGWLSDLVAEVGARAPVAVLGSFYRGDMWDKLAMPPAIHHHINGNAVYNHSSPLLQAMIAALSADIQADTLTTAFDVRLAELYLNSTLPAEQFGWYAGDSAVIGNYAHTPMLEAYYSGEALVHGGWLYEEWQGSATLLVSDFGEVDANGTTLLETFQSSLLRGHHPFRSVVVVRPTGLARPPYSRPLQDPSAGSIDFVEVERNASGWLDWCSAAVPTSWFLYTNVYFDFGRRVDLMQSIGTDLPIIGYVPANSSFCGNGSACPYSVQRAANFTQQSVDSHYDLSHVLFHTPLRDAFCRRWQLWNASRDLVPDACDPIPGPTADDYMADLAAQGVAGLYYEPVNVLLQGQRDWGVLRFPPHDARPCAFATSMPNASACDFAADAATCLAIPGCAYHAAFGTCFNGTLPAVVEPPAFSIATNYSGPDCRGDLVVPALSFDPAEQAALGLQFESVALAAAPTAGGPAQLPMVAYVTAANTAPRLRQPYTFAAYNLSGLVAVPDTQRTVYGRRVLLIGPAAFLASVSPLPTFESPVNISSNDWVTSADTKAPGLIVLNTAGLPLATTSLTVRTRLLLSPGGHRLVRCAAATVELLPAPLTLCSAAVTFSPAAAQGGQAIHVNTTAFGFWEDQASIVNYTWTIGGSVPVVTSVPQAFLTAPYTVQASTVPIMVKATDAYGRVQTCSVDFPVVPTAVDVLVQASQANGCSNSSGLSAAGQDHCLQLAGGLAAGATAADAPVALVQSVLSAVLASMASDFQPTSPTESNVALERLAAMVEGSNPRVVDDTLQAQVVDVLERLETTGVVDSATPAALIPVVAPLLQNIVAATSAVPSYDPRNGTVTNVTLARDTAARLDTLLDSLLSRVACSLPRMYTTSAYQPSDGCINATWALQTSTSLPGDYREFRLAHSLSAVLPAEVRVVLLSIAHDCNVHRDALKSTAELHRLLFLNATSCARLPDAYFAQTVAAGTPLWGAKLVFQAPPFPTAAGGKFRAQAAATTKACLSTSNGVVSQSQPQDGYCYTTLSSGSVTGTWDAPARAVFAASSPSPSPPVAAAGSTGFDLGSYWWAILVPLVVVAGVAIAVGVWLYVRHQPEGESPPLVPWARPAHRPSVCFSHRNQVADSSP
eukprot:EG_transcript_806